MATKKVNPMRITAENGDVYTLDFTRDSCKFAEDRGFDITQIRSRLVTGPADLFYYVFRANHRSVTQHFTDRLLEQMGGLTAKQVNRLVDLYMQVVSTHSLSDDEEGTEKNASVTVELL